MGLITCRALLAAGTLISLCGGKTKNDIQKYKIQCLARDF